MFQDLIKFGLADKEAKIYLALLEMGPSTVTEISKKAKITRTNGYHVLNGLITKGLVSTYEEKSKMVFIAENPERIVSMLEENLKEIETNIQRAKKVLPEFKAIHRHPTGKLKIKFYEGVEGIISVYEDTLTARSTILGYASVENQHSFMPGYFPEYYDRRTRRGIPVKAILAYTENSFRIKDLDKAHIRTSKIIPVKYRISPEIDIYDDKVTIMSLKEKFGAIIESREVADAFKKLFMLAYERSSEYDEKIGKKYDPELEKQMNKEADKMKDITEED
ncbi:MAG: transcriptional regulator TrmB [Candidatus Peregrinibacteria bacterium GW2011_GWC2_39_14]|nr:MAG: Transcriptional regulator, TrmB [Candidatus Peregrinibacteria bacterium GW2011_GWA2_38_36]KKR07212.1 MAG: transcriptional regulator TrmB [Candidatus Peregrinibacteria bacterium GW2011_GWC2_39_14]